MQKYAYQHFEDGRKWLRIIEMDGDDVGDVWDECISEWIMLLDLTTGKSYYRHKLTKQEIYEAPSSVRAYA